MEPLEKTECDHIVRYDSGYAFLGDEDVEAERPELLTATGEVISYDITFSFCPNCGVKLESV